MEKNTENRFEAAMPSTAIVASLTKAKSIDFRYFLDCSSLSRCRVIVNATRTIFGRMHPEHRPEPLDHPKMFWDQSQEKEVA
jgi:hypothetical protein